MPRFLGVLPSIVRRNNRKGVWDLVETYCPYIQPPEIASSNPNLHSCLIRPHCMEQLPRFEAIEMGRRFHKAASHYLNGEISQIVYSTESKEWEQFLEYVRDNSYSFFRSEMNLLSESYMINGRADFVAKLDCGTLGLVDFKRSAKVAYADDPHHGHYVVGVLAKFGLKNNNYTRNALSCNLYRKMLEFEGCVVGPMSTVFFHPNLETYKVVEIERMEAEIDAILEDRTRELIAQMIRG